MKRIEIDVTKAELDYLREALVLKHNNLISYLELCEELSTEPTLDDLSKITEDDFNEELRIISGKKEVKKTRKAQFGLKKDGTPKAKPGRKA